MRACASLEGAANSPPLVCGKVLSWAVRQAVKTDNGNRGGEEATSRFLFLFYMASARQSLSTLLFLFLSRYLYRRRAAASRFCKTLRQRAVAWIGVVSVAFAGKAFAPVGSTYGRGLARLRGWTNGKKP
ncbi:uncharacterized protein BDZ83DRAFT_348584 [Colletotrichum acutatum]|uniref:Uncharacterized protein n=1 Tax=Glomerella acutata TaxID=27357 RepID=A0AAD8UMM5_GLOAC|nr:uncharacterized protein BDZ83DRAFT_348584 [Colletotrichum acutatum]KAK1724609.1 hypothetical protein BDZ83DRAFT_348584 [Colletotrichum acutatum]